MAALWAMRVILSNRLPTADTSSQDILEGMSTSSRQTPWGTHSGHGHTAGYTMISVDLSSRLRTADTSLQVKLSPSALSPTMCTSLRRTLWGPSSGHGGLAGLPMSAHFLFNRLPT